jgi:hypothetical protein
MLRFIIPSSASRKIIISSSTTLILQRSSSIAAVSSSLMMLKPTQTLLMPAWMEADLKQKKKERERRQLEKMGIDPDEDEQAGDWVDPEEQARLDAEKAEKEKLRRAQEEERRAARDKLDAEKKEKLKKFRAVQHSKTQKVRAEVEARRNQNAGAHRDGRAVDDGEVEEVAVAPAAKPAEETKDATQTPAETEKGEVKK